MIQGAVLEGAAVSGDGHLRPGGRPHGLDDGAVRGLELLDHPVGSDEGADGPVLPAQVDAPVPWPRRAGPAAGGRREVGRVDLAGRPRPLGPAYPGLGTTAAAG